MIRKKPPARIDGNFFTSDFIESHKQFTGDEIRENALREINEARSDMEQYFRLDGPTHDHIVFCVGGEFDQHDDIAVAFAIEAYIDSFNKVYDSALADAAPPILAGYKKEDYILDGVFTREDYEFMLHYSQGERKLNETILQNCIDRDIKETESEEKHGTIYFPKSIPMLKIDEIYERMVSPYYQLTHIPPTASQGRPRFCIAYTALVLAVLSAIIFLPMYYDQIPDLETSERIVGLDPAYFYSSLTWFYIMLGVFVSIFVGSIVLNFFYMQDFIWNTIWIRLIVYFTLPVIPIYLDSLYWEINGGIFFVVAIFFDLLILYIRFGDDFHES